MDKLLSHLTVLDDQHDIMLQQVIDLADTNSGTMHLAGLEAVKKQLVTLFSSLDADLKLVDSHPMMTVNDAGEEVYSPLGQSIHLRCRPEAAKQVLLCIHMDTVYGADHSFQKCRKLDDGRINGPGVADAKGGLIVMLHALQTLEMSPLADQIGWEVLINPDEEIGSPGSINIINEIAGRCDFGLLFEPALSDNKLVSWRKGSGNFSFVVKGKSAHAGREFSLGRNAIAAAARLADRIDQLNVDPEVTFNLGRISGGGALNVVPDNAVVRVNVRVRTVAEQDKVERQLNELVTEFNQLDGISIKMYGKFSSPPKPICPAMEKVQQRIERCGNLIGLDLEWQGTGGASDGNKFAAAGLPNIDSLGPCGGRIHSREEYLIPESLVPRAKLAALILLSYAQEAT